MNSIRAFVSYDPEHDRELFDVIVTQSKSQSSGFSIVGSSERATADALCSKRTRDKICGADQLIIICGERSEACATMHAELRIAQQEDKPYTLLWGRREIMCTKPSGTKPSDGMYSWTLPILKDQIDYATRSAKWRTPSDEFVSASKAKRTGSEAADS